MMMILAVLNASAKGKGDWKGKVVDEQGQPIEFANVAVLSKADSTVLCGTVTAEDGTFNIVTKENDGIMMVAILGYQTVYLAPVDGAVITLREDASLLESAAITAIMPKTKLTGEGIATSVRGSVLENAGTANDVLKKVPGLIKGQNGLEVIGKGAPVVYINGRRLTDASELDRLLSHEIQSVEVINNPGAQYDASIKAVVRIKTIKRQGEGFGFNVNLVDAQSLTRKDNNDPTGALNVNYRTGGVDIFAGVNGGRTTQYQISELIHISSLMVKKIDTSHPTCLLIKRSSVRTIGVGTRFKRLVTQLLERQSETNPARKLPDHILSPLDCRDLSETETIFLNLPLLHIELGLLLTK